MLVSKVPDCFAIIAPVNYEIVVSEPASKGPTFVAGKPPLAAELSFASGL